MPAKRFALWAVLMSVVSLAGCCRWCEHNCPECRAQTPACYPPAPAPVAQPACYAPPAQVSYPAPVPAGTQRNMNCNCTCNQ